MVQPLVVQTLLFEGQQAKQLHHYNHKWACNYCEVMRIKDVVEHNVQHNMS